MKVYEVIDDGVASGIHVARAPYPHVVLGEGGNKRATWVALGKGDAERIIRSNRMPCPKRRTQLYTEEVLVGDKLPTCKECGERYTASKYAAYSIDHPDSGEVEGPACIFDVAVIQLKDGEGKPNGKYLIVAPRGEDNRILVLWRVESGYRGSASITAGEGVTVIARDTSWHSGRGSLGETAEMLAILRPGQELRASRSGRRVQETEARLGYDGKAISVTFGGEEMDAAMAEEASGEVV